MTSATCDSSESYQSNSINQNQINTDSIYPVNISGTNRVESNNPTINFSSIIRIDSNQLPSIQENEINISTEQESRKYLTCTYSTYHPLSTFNFNNLNQ